MATESATKLTTQEVAAKFHEMAQLENWFGIQEEFFAENVKSTDPANSPYFGFAEGKAAVRKKGEDFMKDILAVHHTHTTAPLVTGNHFAVGRKMDLTLQKYGRIQINQIMLYEVIDGKIVSEQFFY